MIRSVVLGGLLMILAAAAGCGSTSCRDACEHRVKECQGGSDAAVQSCTDGCNLFEGADKQKNIDCWADASCDKIKANPTTACGLIGPGPIGGGANF